MCIFFIPYLEAPILEKVLAHRATIRMITVYESLKYFILTNTF